MKNKISLIIIFYIIFIVLFSCVLAGDTGDSSNGGGSGGGGGSSEDYTAYNKLFDPYNVHEFEIRITKNNLDQMVADMIQHNINYPVTWNPSLNNYRVNRYYKADLVYKGALGDQTVSEIGFRTKGNFWTRHLPYNPQTGQYQRTHFRIKFNKTFDDMTVGSGEYEKRKDRRFANLKELILRWSQDKDTTQIREMFAQNIHAKAGIYAARAAKVKLYLTVINNDNSTETIDYGLYTILEPVDKQFLTKRFGKNGNDGNLYKCLYQRTPADLTPSSIEYPGYDIGIKDWENNYIPTYDRNTNEDDTNYSDIINFINNLNNLTGQSFIDYIDSNFDVDQFLKVIAMNFLIGNPDDYWGNGQNYYLYFHNNGKIVFIPYDLDHCLGAGWEGGYGWTGPGSVAQADIYDGFKVPDNNGLTNRPLVDKILAVQKYREKYEDYLDQFTSPGGVFTYNSFLTAYNSYYSIYSGYVENDIFLGESMSMDNFIFTYMTEKNDSVIAQLANRNEVFAFK